jgi:hypothetical protein
VVVGASVVAVVAGGSAVVEVVDVVDGDVELGELQVTTPDVPPLWAQRMDPALHPTERDWPGRSSIFADEPEAVAATTIEPHARTERMTKTAGLRFESICFNLL